MPLSISDLLLPVFLKEKKNITRENSDFIKSRLKPQKQKEKLQNTKLNGKKLIPKDFMQF